MASAQKDRRSLQTGARERIVSGSPTRSWCESPEAQEKEPTWQLQNSFYNSTGKPQNPDFLDELAAQEKERSQANKANKPGEHLPLLAAMGQEHWQHGTDWTDFKEQARRKKCHVLGQQAAKGASGKAITGTYLAAPAGRAQLSTLPWDWRE